MRASWENPRLLANAIYILHIVLGLVRGAHDSKRPIFGPGGFWGFAHSVGAGEVFRVFGGGVCGKGWPERVFLSAYGARFTPFLKLSVTLSQKVVTTAFLHFVQKNGQIRALRPRPISIMTNFLN